MADAFDHAFDFDAFDMETTSADVALTFEDVTVCVIDFEAVTECAIDFELAT